MPDPRMMSLHLEGDSRRDSFRQARALVEAACGQYTIAGDLGVLPADDPGDGPTVAAEKFEAWGKAQNRPPGVLEKTDRLKAMKERVGKDGWVVALSAEHGGQKDDHLGLVLVLFNKDGKPRIVGFED